MEFLQRRYVWAVLYGLLLVSFTLYVVLDTFVITRVYTLTPAPQNDVVLNPTDPTQTQSPPDDVAPKLDEPPETAAEKSGQLLLSDSAAVADNAYSDSNISIAITEHREYDTSIYVADVRISDPAYLQTAFAQNAFGKNITERTSETARANNAILAINGDYYGVQTKGYVLKNGTLYRETASEDQQDLVIWADGSFEIMTEGDVTASQLLENGAVQILSFGPSLVNAGAISVSENEEVGKAKASNPRTAIGIVDSLHYIFVVSDGRTNESDGLTLYQLAAFMQSMGAQIAYNLDGGGSSTMYFNGAVINNPTTNGRSIREREVSDIVYIGY